MAKFKMRLSKNQYQKLIEPWIASIEKSSLNSKEKKKKILELCHYAAFCIALMESNYIKSYQEIDLVEINDPPLADLEIEFRNSKIGLEICRVTNSKVRRINCQKGILGSAEQYLRKTHPDVKGHFNIYFNDFDVECHSKQHLCKQLVECLTSCNHDDFRPPFVRKISFLEFNTLSLNLSGSYWVGSLSEEIQNQIQKKEENLNSYRNFDQYKKLWLLLVIHGNSPESDFNKLDDEVFNIQSKFECIWILNEFEKRVYLIGNI